MEPARSILLTSTLALVFSATAAADPREKPLAVTPVFEAGKDGYPVYRIPALVQATNGDLLAFCEARQGGDASEIDLVLKRSADGGRSWGALEVVQESGDFRPLFGDEPPPITVGNPAPVVDRLDPEHPGRIWLPFTVENDRVFVTRSDDDGASWSAPREITADVKRPSWGWYATGPVHSIQVQEGPHRGRLVVPADHRLRHVEVKRGSRGAQAVLSDDHGRSWRLGAVDATYADGLEANETTVVELPGGVLYFNTRDQRGKAPGTRGEAWSHDGGETFDSRDSDWKAFRPAPPVLDPPVVQGALLRVADDLILFSAPDEDGPSGEGRSDLRIRFSRDGAKSWQDGPLIHVGPAAYSDMLMVSEDTIGVLFENGDAAGDGPYRRISFATLARERAVVSTTLAPVAPAPVPAAAAPRWKPLSNGEDLSGWKAVGPAAWRVEDGVIVGETESQGRSWLVSREEYSDFVLRLRFRCEGGKSGVRFRSRLVRDRVGGYEVDIDPDEARVTGTLRDEGGRGLLAGALPGTDGVLRRDGWNDCEISALGDHIRVFVNGLETADVRDGRRTKGVIALRAASGRGARVRWGDIRILEVPEGVDWTPLFDRRTLDGWKVIGPETWRVENGAIVGETERMDWGWLVTEREYADFVLRLRFRWEKGNSGIQFRSRLEGGEMHGLQADIFPARPGVTGSLYEMNGRRGLASAPPEVDALVDATGWNDYEISALGKRIQLFVNGLETVDIEDEEGRKKGIVGFQVHRGQDVRVRWKDIRILKLR